MWRFSITVHNGSSVRGTEGRLGSRWGQGRAGSFACNVGPEGQLGVGRGTRRRGGRISGSEGAPASLEARR